MDFPLASDNNNQEDKDLPQCKIKRNYTCNHCLYFTQNPRFYLTHLRDVHGEKITLNNCSLCLYASRHYQKLVRHMKMVHGSTAEKIPGQSRKRPLVEDIVPDSLVIPPLPTPPKWIIDIDNLSYDLKSSRQTLKDIAAIYFAENDIDEILAKMEASDVVEVVPSVRSDVSDSIRGRASTETVFGDPKSVGDEDLDIICKCGHVSKCFFDSINHGKSCSMKNEKDYESSPLDLSVRSTKKEDFSFSPINGIKVEQILGEQDDSKKFKDVSKNTDKVSKMYGCQLSTELIWKTEKENMNTEKPEDHDEMMNTSITQKEEPPTLPSHRKVFKCPLCSFWASTASRFHVHIVGHQNKKSFKCSLCSYCSNWRWDITKHIRVRTIRSPSHRNARVVMHGEVDGGRRNYSKYDKYITLVKITEQDDDLKFKRCGELLPNDKDTNNFKDESAKNDEEQKPLKCSAEKVVQTAAVLSSLPEVMQNDNKIKNRFKDFSPRNYLIFEDGEKPCYKCSICYFWHPNRDAVLVHVKFQHHDLMINSIISSKSEETTAEKCEDSNKLPIDEIKTSTEANDESMNDALDSIIVDVENYDDDDTIISRGNKIKKLAQAQFASPLKDSLDSVDNKVTVGLMAQDIASSTNNSEFEVKTPAAFRCWHCHQVSNWKHVIQRHCRLKHSGSIRIETIDRSLDIQNPIYRMLNLPSNSLESSPVGSGSQLETKIDKSCDDQKKDNIQTYCVDSEKEHEKALMDSKNIPLNMKNADQKLSKFKCTECSFVCTSEITLNKHFAKKHTPSSIVHNTRKSKKSCDKEETSNLTAISAGNKEISNENNMTLHAEKYHNPCKSDIKEENESNFKPSKEIVAKITNHLQFDDNLDLNVTDNCQKIENPPSTENKSLKKNSETNSHIDKIDKEPHLNTKHTKTSSVNSNNLKHSLAPKAALPKKTIFVNPKTGQIVRRN